MEPKSTDMLMHVLLDADRADLPDYQARYLAGEYADFPAYMDALIAEKHFRRQDILQRADLPWKYGYKLLSGERHTSDRDKLLRLFIAMGLTLRETQRALSLYGMPALYPKRRRDAVLIIAFNRQVNDVDTVNEWLAEAGEPELTPSGE